MLKCFSVCVLLFSLGSSVNAQQREAVLHKVEVPGADYMIVVAMPKFPKPKYPNMAIDFRGEPDPQIAYIAGGQLVLGIDDAVERTFKDIASLLHPVCHFHAKDEGINTLSPVGIYLLRRGETREPISQRPTPVSSLTRIEMPGDSVEILLRTGRLLPDGEPIWVAVGPEPRPKCSFQIERNDGAIDVVAVYVVPSEKTLQ
jgi:hypothetical protein